jgi:hypothetical protein
MTVSSNSSEDARTDQQRSETASSESSETPLGPQDLPEPPEQPGWFPGEFSAGADGAS